MKKEVKLGRKGQITIFIIIGLVLVIALAMFAYFRTSVEKEADVVSTEGLSVITFVESCMENVARDGIRTLGLNGGYINLPPQVANNPISYMPATPIKELINPYWWYDGIDAVPSESFLRQQIEEHVTNELEVCLNNFEELKTYEIRELDEIKTDVTLTAEDVSIKVDYPLLVKKEEESMRIEEFRVDIPIRLKKIYQLAKRIMEEENQDMFIEKKTIDLISMDEDVPVSDVKLTCSKKQWMLSDIREKISKLIRVNLPYIKIKGTDYNPQAYVPTPTGADTYENSYYNYHFIWDLNTEENLNDIHVSFSYDDKWPLAVYARPSRNGILSSNAEKGQEMLAFFCMHIWHFTYDIIYPVMTSIADEKTNDHDRFLFRFPFKVSVNHNQPYRENFGHLLVEGTEKPESEEYCGTPRNEVTIYTSDKATQESIADVDLTFVCGRFRCDIGGTEWLGYGASSGLTKKLPYCTQAVLIGNKDGYDESKTFIQTDLQGKTYNLEMVPIKEFDSYFVSKHLASNPLLEDFFEEGEKAVVTISVPEKDFESYGVYPSTGSLPIKFLDKEDNTYKVAIYVTQGEDLVGGYMGNWTVTKDQLDTAESIKFHVLSTDANTDEQRFFFLSELESHSKDIPGPEFR